MPLFAQIIAARNISAINHPVLRGPFSLFTGHHFYERMFISKFYFRKNDRAVGMGHGRDLGAIVAFGIAMLVLVDSSHHEIGKWKVSSLKELSEKVKQS